VLRKNGAQDKRLWCVDAVGEKDFAATRWLAGLAADGVSCGH